MELHHHCYENLKSHHKFPFFHHYLPMLKDILQLNIYSVSALTCFSEQCVFRGSLSQFLSLWWNHFSC
jgi:hypothetical protein